MQPEAGGPEEWLEFARADLLVAERADFGPRAVLRVLCFHAQQAAEMAIKAVLAFHHIDFPLTHDIARLLGLLPTSATPPPDVRASVELIDYAVARRYPGPQEWPTHEEYEEALRLAQGVVAWAESVLTSGQMEED